jgi:antitoxin component YwqK of YwqJK toxin-antitoxin module
MRRVFVSASLVLLLACNSQPSEPSSKVEQAPKVQTTSPPTPEPTPEPDIPEPIELNPGPQPEPLSKAVIDAPIPTEPPPLDFWTKGDAACEPGGRLDGAAPPDGKEIRCVDAEGRWTGMEARFHANGKLQSIGRKHENRMIGVWLFFHASGAKSVEQTYVDGQLHGTQRRWAENGQELEYGEYRGGRPWGLFIQRDEQGQELGRAQLEQGTGVLVSASLTRRTESDYVNGLLHGTHRAFDAEGHRLEESHWSGGELHGLQTRWNALGQRLFEGQWKNGEQHTRFAAEQIVEKSIWIEGKEVARQLFRDGAPLATLPTPSDCDTDAGLSKVLESARGKGLPDERACVTRVPLFPGVIMLGSFAYDRGCMGADFVVDCKLVTPAPSSAELLARAGWAKASGEQRLEIAEEYIREFALRNEGNVTSDPDEPQWKVLDDGGVEGVVWVAEPAGMRRGVDKDHVRFTFAADRSLAREVLQHVSGRDD